MGDSSDMSKQTEAPDDASFRPCDAGSGETSREVQAALYVRLRPRARRARIPFSPPGQPRSDGNTPRRRRRVATPRSADPGSGSGEARQGSAGAVVSSTPRNRVETRRRRQARSPSLQAAAGELFPSDPPQSPQPRGSTKAAGSARNRVHEPDVVERVEHIDKVRIVSHAGGAAARVRR